MLATGQAAVMPCGWEGNRKSGVAPAMRRRLQWFIHLRAHRLRNGDEYPAYTSREVWHTLPFYTVRRCGTLSVHVAWSVCLCVCVCWAHGRAVQHRMSARREHIPGTTVQFSPNFWSSCGGAAIFHVLPVLWVASCVHSRDGENGRE